MALRGSPQPPPAVRHVLRAGLVEGSVLAIAPRGTAGLRRGLGPGTSVIEPEDLADVSRAYRTVLDLVGLPATATERTRHAKALAQVVEPAGFLHILCRSEVGAIGRRRPGVAQSELVRVFRRGWTLLAVHDSWTTGPEGPRHAWLATFVHGPARRRRPAPMVRHFTDLGAFGSLDLGTATDRPPWGT